MDRTTGEKGKFPIAIVIIVILTIMLITVVAGLVDTNNRMRKYEAITEGICKHTDNYMICKYGLDYIKDMSLEEIKYLGDKK